MRQFLMIIIFAPALVAGMFLNQQNTALAQENEKGDCPDADRDPDGYCPDVIEIVGAEPVAKILEDAERTTARVDAITKLETGDLALLKKRDDYQDAVTGDIQAELKIREIQFDIGAFVLSSDFEDETAIGATTGLVLPLGDGDIVAFLGLSIGGYTDVPGEKGGMNVFIGGSIGAAVRLNSYASFGLGGHLAGNVAENGNDTVFAALGLHPRVDVGPAFMVGDLLIGKKTRSKEITDSEENEEDFGLGVGLRLGFSL